MDVSAWLAVPVAAGAEGALAEVNRLLAVGGLSITGEDVRMLAERRAEALVETERVEFGTPAIVAIVGAVATSPCLSQDGIAHDLVKLQDAFYAIRDELPVDVPDAEIADALRICLDEWGDADEVAVMPSDEIMRFSAEYMRETEAEDSNECCIVDDEGRAYVFDPVEWGYDEQADGWDGERWSDDWDD